VVKPLAIGGLVVAALCSCGAASDGAALVHGTLYQGESRFETSLEFTGRATIHGAGPFRVVVTRPEASSRRGRGGKLAGLTIELQRPLLPESGVALPIGGAQSPTASVDLVVPDDAEPTALQDGADVRYSDGGFTAQAVGGTLLMDFDGRQKGDGARGSFELVFKTGERVTGTFAAALAD